MENLIEGNSQPTKFCKHCGEKILLDAVVCTKCGRQVEELKAKEPNVVINNTNTNNVVANANATNNTTPLMYGNAKNKTVSIILCLLGFLGIAGIHKFYEGKIFMGIIYFFTCGFFFIGTVIDFIALLVKPKQYYV